MSTARTAVQKWTVIKMRLIDADKFRLALLIWRDAIHTVYGNSDAVDKVLEMLDKQQTVDNVKHGHWVTKDSMAIECSCCKGVDYMRTPYCWRCGAKMDEAVEVSNGV